MTVSGSDSCLTRTIVWFGARNLVVGALCAAGGPVIAVLLPQTHGWAKVGVVTGAVVLALAGFTVPAAKSKLADQRADEAESAAQAAGTSVRVAMTHTLLPALSSVVSGVDPRSSDHCDEVVAEAVALVLASAARLCDNQGQGRVRACWYKLEANGPGKVSLKPKKFFGRGVCPSTAFSITEPRGEALLRLLIRDQTELWTDLSVATPPNWKATKNTTSYKSFLVVPVRTNTSPFGLLMVDSDEARGLTEADVPAVQTLAWVLALALSQREVGALPASAPTSRSAS